MPRFFFDTDDGVIFIKDEEGFKLPDRASARLEALGALRDMAAISHKGCTDHQNLTVVVRDASGKVIYRATVTLNGGWVD